MKKKVLISSIFISLLLVLCIAMGIQVFREHNKVPGIKKIEKEAKKYKESNYNVKLIKTVNSVTSNNNYLISPYSIEIALNMLREGANDYTKEEIDNVISEREIKDISIKDKISVANALFIKTNYKDYIKDDFKNKLSNNYNADILLDEFKSPEVINNWASEKTNKMIEKVIDDIDKDFILGLANAIAIDVEWNKNFNCENTSSEEFTKIDNTKINIEMMHNSYTAKTKYINNNLGEGIIIPYETLNDSYLEFIGFMPKKSINDYIENLTKEDLTFDKGLEEANSDTEIQLSLPRFTYEHDLKEFKNVLIAMGIEEVFNSEKADLTNMYVPNDSFSSLYVSKAVHKTKIELTEKGTKAAAVTYFGVSKNAAPSHNKKIINISFNKPFIYMIRDNKTKEILFFGTLYEPNIWQGSTCEE